jgi:hypothetical protein
MRGLAITISAHTVLSELNEFLKRYIKHYPLTSINSLRPLVRSKVFSKNYPNNSVCYGTCDNSGGGLFNDPAMMADHLEFSTVHKDPVLPDFLILSEGFLCFFQK